MAESRTADLIEESIIRKCGSRLGYTMLKTEQLQAITSFIHRKDTFVALPMGYGKSLIYAVLPLVFDTIRCRYTYIVV